MVRFLALGYSGLDKHAEAAALLEKIPKPAKPEDEKSYHAARLLYVHELRLAKKRAQVFHSLAAALLRGMWCLNTVLGRAAPDGYTNGVEPSTGLSRALHGDCRCNRFIIWIRYLFALP